MISGTESNDLAPSSKPLHARMEENFGVKNADEL